MSIEVKVPMLPESIADATVSTWHKKAGDSVSRDENIVDLETDKVMLEVPSPVDGVIKEIKKNTGDVVQANEILVIIDEGAIAGASPKQESSKQAASPAQASPAQASPAQASPAQASPAQASPAQASPAQASPAQASVPQAQAASQAASSTLSPSARRAAAEHEINVGNIQGTGKGGRITKENVLNAVQTSGESGRPEKRVPMTRIRTRIAERLLEVSQTTAMLTTFNEVNLQHVIEIRNKYKEKFEKVHNTRLGFMSFFVKAAVEALKRFPLVNASIDGNDIVYHGYFDIGVAVSTDRGLVVPVLRDADKMSMSEIESTIADYANKARAGKLTLEEMQGGTFTITNGGVFGSLLSTPILNSPQSAILGMHKIEERPIVENGQIVIRPMMYLAMSYDHRIIDGKDSVTFLVAIKDMLEDPSRMLLEI